METPRFGDTIKIVMPDNSLAVHAVADAVRTSINGDALLVTDDGDDFAVRRVWLIGRSDTGTWVATPESPVYGYCTLSDASTAFAKLARGEEL